jgi:hypothetical protein
LSEDFSELRRNADSTFAVYGIFIPAPEHRFIPLFCQSIPPSPTFYHLAIRNIPENLICQVKFYTYFNFFLKLAETQYVSDRGPLCPIFSEPENPVCLNDRQDYPLSLDSIEPPGQNPCLPAGRTAYTRHSLLLATTQLKKQKRVGRFLWKNLEAKPLNFELAQLRIKKSRSKGRTSNLQDLYDRHSRFWRKNLPTLSASNTSAPEELLLLQG